MFNLEPTVRTRSIGVLYDASSDESFYFLDASEADMQELFMEYCHARVDDSLMELQFEKIQLDSDEDWMHYYGLGTGTWTQRYATYKDMIEEVALEVYIDFINAIEM